jgi:Fe-S cluster assembly iron-binding protein IscA
MAAVLRASIARWNSSKGEAVLQITQGAATFLSELRRGHDMPDTYGLRVFPESTAPGEVSIGLGFTDTPREGDQVTEQDGLRIFVAPELAQPLDEAQIDVARKGGTPRIVFRQRVGAAS